MKDFPDIKNKTDNELISLFKETENNLVFGELYKRYTRFVFCVCMKYLKNRDNSKDAVMEIFEKLISDLKTVEVKNFKPWLYTVAKNHCLLKLRSEKYHLKKESELQTSQDSVMENQENLYLYFENDNEEKLKLLDKAIENLSKEQRKCIDLFYLQDKSYEDVSYLTGYSMNQVKSYIQNGKRNIKIYMLEYERKIC